ncbi:flagellar motor protein MotB [Skermanella stibiiresistens]|uniref:flagellar motor protein MotB n=1 Tax=Skermanella stibiiresistens TaxID=913326 RepID=UPI0004B5B6E0|nr:flagellar motor protein MotB [Skermanella stibiiresistens]
MAPPPPSPGNNQQPVIIIKRKRKRHHDAHHGGAWKVAYADFVTAMMAFFLLLWLLNVTTSQQRKGIADYFSPASVSRETSGSGGVLGGLTITVPGAMISPGSPMNMTQPTASRAGESEKEPNQISEEQYDAAGMSTAQIEDKALREEMAKREQKQFDEAEKTLRKAIEGVPELSQLADSLMIEQTPEGLRIQIVDQANYSMFPLGSAQMYPPTRQLLGLVAQAVGRLPNKLSISGHTDGTRFARGDIYGNWELSTDRANSSRRALIAGGIDETRIATVVGRADRDHLLPTDPQSPRNRRISIILLRDIKPLPKR